MTYSPIVESYLHFQTEIDLITIPFLSYVNEADNGNSAPSGNTKNDGTGFQTNPNQNNTKDASNLNKEANMTIENTKNSPEFGRKILDAIKKAIETLHAFIQKSLLHLKNAFKKLMVTDKGFKEKLRERERTVKPLQAVRITSYQYLDPFIDTFVSNLGREIIPLINEINLAADPRNPKPTKSELLKKANNDMVTTILQTLTKKQEINAIDRCNQYLAETYRGDKRERVYKEADLPNIIRMAEDYRKYNVTYESNIANLDSIVTKMQNRKNQLVHPDITDEQKRDFLSLINKASVLMNLYISILRYIYELKVEKALSYRIICQKFYQF